MYILGLYFSSKVPAGIFEILARPKLIFYDIFKGKNIFLSKNIKIVDFSLEFSGKNVDYHPV